MKIGVFDSGIGGLLILKHIVQKLPNYDYLYIGDTKRAPYGNRSHEEIFTFTKEAVEYLFKNGCELVILACNTASARALRRLQQEYLPFHYPTRKILGVIIPAAETACTLDNLGIIATPATVESKTFLYEIQKLNPRANIYQIAAPKLVPLIENGDMIEARETVTEYLKKLPKSIDGLILGCTHYSLLEEKVRNILGEKIVLINEQNIIPDKLSEYLKNHTEIEERLTQSRSRIIYVTLLNPHIKKISIDWFGKSPVEINLQN